MKNRIRRVVLAAAFLLASGLPFALPLPALAAGSTAKTEVCQAIGSGNDCKTNANGGITIQSIITFAVNMLSIIVGIAAVIMIIVASLRFITSGGDPSKVASAKSAIMYAVIGLVVAATAQVLVHFVLTQASGTASCKSNPKIAVSNKACKDPKPK